VTIVIAAVHPVHLMNADLTPGRWRLSNQANRLGLWVRLYATTVYTHHRRLLLLLNPKARWYAFFHPTYRVEGTVDLLTLQQLV